MYCEDPNFVISVAYKIQFGSKVNQSLLELDTSSSVAFKKLLGLLTQLQQDTKGNNMDIFSVKEGHTPSTILEVRIRLVYTNLCAHYYIGGVHCSFVHMGYTVVNSM